MIPGYIPRYRAAPTAPAVIPVGLPSDLLRRRPDVRAAERNLAAATAEIGVAVADLYPSISLTGAIHLVSGSLSTLISSDSLQPRAGAALMLPLLDGGRRRATVDLRQTQAQEALLTYQGAVLIALFLWLTRRIMHIGRQAIALDRVFSGLVAQGVAIWIGFQAFINMGVNLGALPTKGLTLPLMSFGGSAILLNLVALAVVLRVDYENKLLMRGGRV